MLNKEEELGCFEILKNNFPNLNRQGLVIGLDEFLSPNLNMQKFICNDNQTIKIVAASYIEAQKPYIILDESEG